MDAHATQHPTDQTLIAYGLGKLDDRADADVNRAFGAVPECRKRVAEMSADSFLGRVRDAQKPGQSCDVRSVTTRRDKELQSDQRPSCDDGRTRSRRDWPTTPTTRSSGSSAGAAWAWSTWPTTS